MYNRPGLVLIQLVLALAAVAIVATAIVYTAQRLTPETTVPASNANVVANTNAAANVNTENNANAAANVNATADATEEWKTYTSTRYRVTFRYPPDMTVGENEQMLGGSRTGEASNAKKTKHFNLSILERTLDPKNVQGTYGKMDTTTVKVGQQDGFQYIEGDAGCGGKTIQNRLTDSLTLRLYFGQCDAERNEFETDATLRERFLSTFQFTDQTAATKDWKTYTNAPHGFTFQYPRNWSVAEDNIQREGVASGVNRLTIKQTDFAPQPEMVLYYNHPTGEIYDDIDKRITLQRSGSRLVITKEEDAKGTRPDSRYYTIDAKETDSQEPIHIMFQNWEGGRTDWDSTVKQIISTFQFTD